MNYDKKIRILDIMMGTLVVYCGIMSALDKINPFDAGLAVGFAWYFWRSILLSKKTAEEFKKLKEWATSNAYNA